MTEIIAIDGLTKSFGKHRALAGLDLEVRAGEVHGFLGQNGAGKSTTINVLMGLLKPDSGTVRLLDGDPRADAVELHRRVAHVPGDVELWPSLMGGETIDLLGRMRGGHSSARRADLVDRFDLDTGKKAKTYSTGNRQKVVLVAAFASDAEVLILDEPTSGLDPLMEIVFQEEVERARADGRTVLLSSHILAEVERLADGVTIVRNGVTVETGSLAELRHLTGTSVEAVTNTPAAGVASWPGVSDVVQNGLDVRFQVAADGLDAAVAGLGRFGIRALTCAPPSLEELMLRHYDDSAGGER